MSEGLGRAALANAHSRRISRWFGLSYLLVFGLWVYLSGHIFPEHFGRISPATAEQWLATVAFMLVSGAALYFGMRLLIERSWRHPESSEAKASWQTKELGYLVPLVVFVLLALGVFSAGTILFQNFSETVKRERYQELRAVLALKAHEVSAWHQQQRQAIEALVRDPDFDALRRGEPLAKQTPEAAERLRRRLASFAQGKEVEYVALFDGLGKIEFSSGIKPGGAEQSQVDEVPAALTARTPTVLPLETSSPEADYRVRLGYIQALGSPEGLGGALLLSINPEITLLPVLETWPTPSRSGETAMLQVRGENIVRINRLRHPQAAAPPSLQEKEDRERLGRMVVTGILGPLEATDYRGLRVMGIGQPIAGSPWHLVTKVDVSEVEEPIAERAVFAGVLALVFVLGAGAVVWLWWQRQRAWILAREVAETRAAQTALKASESRFRDLTEMSSDWYWEQDENFRFTTLSEGLRRCGISPEKFLGKTRWDSPGLDATPSEDWEAHRQCVEAHLPFDNFCYCRRGEDGDLLWQTVSGHPVFDSEGKFTGYRGVGHDITEQKQAQDELRHLNATLEERVQARTRDLKGALAELESFSYSVSHDLRAPLRAIDGFSAAIENRCGATLDAESHDYLARTRRAAQRLGQLIDDLLQLSRVGRAELSQQRVNMSSLAGEVAREIAAEDPSRKIEWVIAQNQHAQADPQLVRLVLQNLLANAWKYTSKHASARIEFGCRELPGAPPEFYVRDDGAGFDPAHASRLFGAFQRLHHQDDFPGTGVGLAIVKRIIERHGGAVRAQAALEQGAIFYFTLAPESRA